MRHIFEQRVKIERCADSGDDYVVTSEQENRVALLPENAIRAIFGNQVGNAAWRLGRIGVTVRSEAEE